MSLKQFGDKLKTLRQSQGLKQKDLAEKLGCSGTYISKLERGKALYPPAKELIEDIAFFFGEDYDHLSNLAGRASTDAIADAVKLFRLMAELEQHYRLTIKTPFDQDDYYSVCAVPLGYSEYGVTVNGSSLVGAVEALYEALIYKRKSA